MRENGSRERSAASRRPGAFLVALCALLFILVTTTADAQDSGSSAASAEKGKINGKVVSSETGEPLAFANIVLFQGKRGVEPGKPAGGASTQADGSYRIVTAPGTYWMTVSYISFNPTHVEEVVVTAGGVAELNVSLVPEAVKLEEIQVTATAIRTSEAALLSNQKKSATVSDAVSSEQIKKSTDSDAAEVMQRVTGVSVVDDKFVFVRGLGERYSSAQVNGTTVGSPEPNKRILPLDLFASGLLDNIVVQKTYTVDKPGDFGGGLVDINTREFPGQSSWSLGIGSGANGKTTGETFLVYDAGSKEFLGLDLGFDDGSRDLPSAVDEIAGDQIVRQAGVGGVGLTREQMIEVAHSFSNVWSPRRESGRVPRNMSASYGNEVRPFGRPLGLIFSGSYSNSFQRKSGERNAYQNALLEPAANYLTDEFSNEVLWGLTSNASLRVSKSNTLKLWTMYNRSAEDLVRSYEGYNDGQSADIRSNRLQYVERGLFSTTAGMSHHLAPLLGSTLDWELSYSMAKRNEPDRREYVYQFFPSEEEGVPGEYRMLIGGAIGTTSRLYETLHDWDRGAKGDWSVPFRQWGGLESKLKIGVAYSGKDRESHRRVFRYSARNQGTLDLSAPPESIFTYENIESRTVSLQEDTRSTDNYSGEQRSSAVYTMLDVPLTKQLRMNTGVRIEHVNQEVVTFPLFQPGAPALVASPRTTEALPAVNLTYAFNQKTNLRGGFSKTVNRPELSELSPAQYYDYIGEEVFRGNPDVRPAKLTNYDLRLERYPAGDELLAVSTFYKDLRAPINRSYLPSQEDEIISSTNAKDGFMYGAEFEARLGLRRASSALASWKVGGNVTIVESEVRLEENAGETQRVSSFIHPLEGQSPYVLNLGVYYEPSRSRLAGSVLYTAFGERLEVVGVGDLPDKFETARGSLDATLAWSPMEALRLKLSGENLLGDDIQFEQAGAITRRYEKGRSIGLSISTGS
ncbi:MAG: TonB-dependent receptor domain-containing protein [bacterium]